MSNPMDFRSKPWEVEQSDVSDGVMVRFFNQVYVWMFVGLMVTAIVSFVGSKNAALMGIIYFHPSAGVIYALGLFAISWFTRSAALRISWAAGVALFLAYSFVMGLLLSAIWIQYPSDTIFSSFLLTGGVFGVFSLLGFVLKINLSKIGPILGFCALGLFAGSIINVFVANDAVSWFITYAIIAVFTGLIVYETQKLKAMARAAGDDADLSSRIAIIGSLTLYISFINIFLSILRILGSRR